MDDYGMYVPMPWKLGVDNFGEEFTVVITVQRPLPTPDVTNVYNEAALELEAA